MPNDASLLDWLRERLGDRAQAERLLADLPQDAAIVAILRQPGQMRLLAIGEGSALLDAAEYLLESLLQQGLSPATLMRTVATAIAAAAGSDAAEDGAAPVH